jgi:F0F1-type ATP synthase membrane subunit c/vacuolar-type H+-ATPase subunit K
MVADRAPTSVAGFLRTLWILYFGLIAALGVYGLVVHAVATGQAADPAAAFPLLPALAAVAAMEVLVVLPLLRRRLLPVAREVRSLDEQAAPETLSPGARAALARYQTAQVVTWAVCESVALYGVVLAVLTHRGVYYLGFAAAALVNFAIYRPRGEVVAAVARGAAG